MKQIWLSGSNSSLIKQEYATLLTGRNFAIDVYTLSFKEYLSFHDCSISTWPVSSQKEIDIKRHFKSYTEWGGFPAVALRNIYQKELGIYLAANASKLFSY